MFCSQRFTNAMHAYAPESADANSGCLFIQILNANVLMVEKSFKRFQVFACSIISNGFEEYFLK